MLALAAHYLITQTVDTWSWAFAVIGGFAVGGACGLFIYGTATDRSDADELTVRGRADVSERGEWRRTMGGIASSSRSRSRSRTTSREVAALQAAARKSD